MIQEYNNKPIYKAYFGENSVVLNVGGSSGTPKINIQDSGIKFGRSTFTEIPEWVDWGSVTDMSEMFISCSKLTTIPQIDTSEVTDMMQMFYNCTSLTSIPQLDTSNVTDMACMFEQCIKLTSIPPLNTSKVTHMSYMFNGCSNLTTIPQLDTSNVTNMDIIFGNCTKLKSIPPLRADNIVVLNYLFNDAKMTALTDFGGLINLKAKSTGVYGFQRCPNLSYQSCINILNGLYDFTGNGETPDSFQGQLKVHSNFLSLVGDEISIGTNKGWTITA